MDEIKMDKKEVQVVCEYICHLERVADREGWAIGDEFSQDSEEAFEKMLEFAGNCERGPVEYMEKTILFNQNI